MHVIQCRNVCEALPAGMSHLKAVGKIEDSRAGRVLVAPTPVTTIYERPIERVLFSRKRNANPYFHLFEALWMLAGRRDAAFLNTFIHDFGDRFAEPDGRIHDAYGYRWREHFSFLDQLKIIIHILREDPNSRQAVLEMWDPVIDLGVPKLKTRPCNVVAFFRIRDERLNMTVCCRSNDIIFGCYGANAVHFSILQEYIATSLGMEVGKYYQVSSDYHAYLTEFDKYVDADLNDNRYPMEMSSLVDDPDSFLDEVEGLLKGYMPVYKNRFLAETAWPLLYNYKERKYIHPVAAQDWRMASQEWLK